MIEKRSPSELERAKNLMKVLGRATFSSLSTNEALVVADSVEWLAAYIEGLTPKEQPFMPAAPPVAVAPAKKGAKK